MNTSSAFLRRPTMICLAALIALMWTTGGCGSKEVATKAKEEKLDDEGFSGATAPSLDVTDLFPEQNVGGGSPTDDPSPNTETEPGDTEPGDTDESNKDDPPAGDQPDDAKDSETPSTGEDAASGQETTQPDPETSSSEPSSPEASTGTSAAIDSNTALAVDALRQKPITSGVDWTYWRGPNYDGVSPETGLPASWDPDGGPDSNVRWKRDDLGSRSTPIVMNGKLYLLCRSEPGTPSEGERVVCIDAMTGQDIWENRFNVWLSDVPKERVAWSSVVGDPETGNVYALGVCGYFQCIDGENGKTIWSVPMHEMFGLLSTYGGRTNFPVICDDFVIISGVVIGWGDMARPAHRFVAFDKRDGTVVWFTGTRDLPYDTTYSAPTVTVLAGQKALVFGSGDGQIWALQPRTGQPIWNYEFSRRGVNVPPLVVGDTVYAAHSEENNEGVAMGAVAAIDATGSGDISNSGEKWRMLEMMVGKAAPIMVDGKLVCIDDRAKLFVLDPETGETLAPRKALGTMMRASPLYADGKIYAVTANGRWYIMQPDDAEGVKILSKGRLSGGCDASPIASHGCVYITTSETLYCLHDASQQTGLNDVAAAADELPVEEDQQPAHVQIVPAEVLLAPGDKQTFEVRLFNGRGQMLGTSEATFQVQGAGAVDGHTFTAPQSNDHTSAVVTADVNGLTGRARIRIVPALPWEFTFEGLSDPPVTWVGARYRHVLREMDGDTVMVKITTIPKGTRSRAWFGSPSLSNYAIQADVRGAIQDDKRPDIGLIAQGYTLDLQGANSALEIRSWVTERRMAKTIAFDWEPDTWYVMKLEVQTDGQQAVVRGKVWPRDEEEPEAWTIEATDPAPNLSGSPGLYGNAKDAEIYLDNIRVMPADKAADVAQTETSSAP